MRPERSSSSSEEGELSEDPQEAAVVSRQTAGGSSRPRQSGKQSSNAVNVQNVLSEVSLVGGVVIHRVHRGGHVGGIAGATTPPGE